MYFCYIPQLCLLKLTMLCMSNYVKFTHGNGVLKILHIASNAQVNKVTIGTFLKCRLERVHEQSPNSSPHDYQFIIEFDLVILVFSA